MGGGDDNVLDSTFLMFHLNEVIYVLLRCALFVVQFRHGQRQCVTSLQVKNMCHCVRVAANQILLLVNRPS